MFTHIHLLQQPDIKGETLALFLESKGYQVQFTPAPKKADISLKKEYPVLFIANLEFFYFRNEAAKAIEYKTNYRAIVLLGKLHHLYQIASFEARSKGFVSVHSKPVNLLNVINEAGKKSLCFGKSIQKYLQKTKLEQQNSLLQKELNKSLTRAELKVMQEISKGKTTNQIADENYRSVHTINNHRKNIKRKFIETESIDLTTFCMLHKDAIQTLSIVINGKLERG